MLIRGLAWVIYIRLSSGCLVVCKTHGRRDPGCVCGVCLSSNWHSSGYADRVIGRESSSATAVGCRLLVTEAYLCEDVGLAGPPASLAGSARQQALDLPAKLRKRESRWLNLQTE